MEDVKTKTKSLFAVVDTKGAGAKRGALAAAGVFISLMVGAGFASGREIMTFFAQYGVAGGVGLLAASGILMVCGWAVMDITHRLKLHSYSAFMEAVLGKPFGAIMVGITNVFIFVMMSAMFSGFAATANEALGLGRTAGTLIIAALCFATFLFDLKGIVRVSSLLAPVLILGGIFFGFYTIIADAEPVFLSLDRGKEFLWPAILYASYNLITAVSVLSALGETVCSRADARRAALLSGAAIAILGLAFFLPIYMNFEVLKDLSVPLLYLAERHGGIVNGIYMIIFFAAIFTTAVSSGFSVIEYIAPFAERKGISRLNVKILVTAAGLCLAHVRFSVFIDKIYPLFGLIGIFEVAVIIVYFIAGKRKAD